jgi:hypothetical protein
VWVLAVPPGIPQRDPTCIRADRVGHGMDQWCRGYHAGKGRKSAAGSYPRAELRGVLRESVRKLLMTTRRDAGASTPRGIGVQKDGQREDRGERMRRVAGCGHHFHYQRLQRLDGRPERERLSTEDCIDLFGGDGASMGLAVQALPGRNSQKKKSVMQVVARDGIEPPTPAFSGPRSTTELSGLGYIQGRLEKARCRVCTETAAVPNRVAAGNCESSKQP